MYNPSAPERGPSFGILHHRIVILLLLCFIIWNNAKKSSAPFRYHNEIAGRSIHSRGAAIKYTAAAVEDFVLQNLADLGYETPPGRLASGCELWRNKERPLYNKLQAFRQEILQYGQRVRDFPDRDSDLRESMSNVYNEDEQKKLCQSVELHPEGLPAMFPSGQLSASNLVGYSEPLLPPQRHPEFCFNRTNTNLMRLDYLVHDFGTLCRNLRKTSRIVLFDMGASLLFHGERLNSPALYLVALFHKFGFWFDHIYAFEATPNDPKTVFGKVPDELLPAYHWYNVPVASTVKGRSNPFTMLKNKFTEDDLVLVKLDVDTPSLELPLVQQLVQDPELARLIDHFYFEHHVHLEELKRNWKQKVNGSVADTMNLFRAVRQTGAMAHFWV